MKINSLLCHSLFYLSFPLLLFCGGFLRWYVATLYIVAILWSVYSIYRLHCLEDNSWELNRGQLISIVALALLCCFFLGVGGYWTQSYDWVVKNPILNELTQSSWPLVVNNSTATTEVKDICGADRVVVVYYLYFYLPAALVGKLVGSLTLARFTLFLWSVYGLVLILSWLLRFVSHTSLSRYITIWVLVCFVVWGGMDILGQCLRVLVLWVWGVTPIRPMSLLDEWCQPYFSYYASHFTSLFWCFNQSIPLWLEMLLILSFRNVCSVGYFYCFSLLYSPWAAIGLLPIVSVIVFESLKKGGRKVLIPMLNFSNVVFPMLVLFLVVTYYASNSTSVVEKGFFWKYIPVRLFVVKYVFFILIEIGVYVWLLRREIKSDIILAISVCLLLLIPFYKMTSENDFIMRASMPALFVLFAYWTRWSVSHFVACRKAILTVLLLSAFTAVQHVYNTTEDTFANHGPVVYKEDVLLSTGDDVLVAHFFEDQIYAHNYAETFFWKYLAK